MKKLTSTQVTKALLDTITQAETPELPVKEWDVTAVLMKFTENLYSKK